MSETKCATCHGSGECQTCNADGELGECECVCGDVHAILCRACDNTGNCPGCDGTGYVDAPAQPKEQP